MKKENVLKVVIVSLVCPVLYLVLQVLVQMAYQFVYGIIHDTGFQNAYAVVEANQTVLSLVGIVVFFAILFIFFKARRKSLSERISWKPAQGPVYGLVAVATIANIIFFSLLQSIVYPDNMTEKVENYSASVASGGILLTILMGVLLGPIGEEIVFRGFMMKRLGMRFPAWFAVVLSTLLFSAAHLAGGIGQLIGTVELGVLFALIFLWTKSIRASILAHVINNAAGLLAPENLFAGLEEKGLPVLLVIVVASLVFMVFIMRLIYQRRDNGAVAVAGSRE
jgi:membrane protease YdiL (CAAX protease family)